MTQKNSPGRSAELNGSLIFKFQEYSLFRRPICHNGRVVNKAWHRRVLSYRRGELFLYENRKILVGNLPVSFDENIISDLFKRVRGTIVSIDLPKDVRTGNNRGYATVEMQSRDEALAAVASLAGLSEVNGRTISISIIEDSSSSEKRRSWFNFGGR